MYHTVSPITKNAAKRRQSMSVQNKLFFYFVFTLLICNTAACLTSRLTGSLAFAATAVLSAFAKILCFNCLNFHIIYPPINCFFIVYHIIYNKSINKNKN